MTRSKRKIPHYYLTQTVELRRALTWLEVANRERPPTERHLPAALFVGWAIALRGGGLVAPANHEADPQPLAAAACASSELANPTVTATSLGERGAETVISAIYPPQVAIVGFGRIVERPWAINGALAVRPLVRISLAADHRASDGHRGSLLLAEIERLLQEPEAL